MGNTTSSSSVPSSTHAQIDRRRSRLAPHSSSPSTTASRSPSVPPPPPSPSPAPRSSDAKQDKQQDKHRLPHRSLRYKKKSLELPDLALALTSSSAPSAGANNANLNNINLNLPPPGSSDAAAAVAMGVAGPYRRPQASTPIAIPVRPGVPGGPSGSTSNNNNVEPKEEARLRTIPTAVLDGSAGPLPLPPDASIAEQDYVNRGRGAASRGAGRGATSVNPHIRGAPLQYNSTRSFAGARGQVSQGNRDGRQAASQSFASRLHPHGGFIPEDVHSSIPLALRKAEAGAAEASEAASARAARLTPDGQSSTGEASGEASTATEGSAAGVGSTASSGSDKRQPAQVHIVCKLPGKSVMLLRAGDNNWKGRTEMDYECAGFLFRTFKFGLTILKMSVPMHRPSASGCPFSQAHITFDSSSTVSSRQTLTCPQRWMIMVLLRTTSQFLSLDTRPRLRRSIQRPSSRPQQLASSPAQATASLRMSMPVGSRTAVEIRIRPGEAGGQPRYRGSLSAPQKRRNSGLRCRIRRGSRPSQTSQTKHSSPRRSIRKPRRCRAISKSSS